MRERSLCVLKVSTCWMYQQCWKRAHFLNFITWIHAWYLREIVCGSFFSFHHRLLSLSITVFFLPLEPSIWKHAINNSFIRSLIHLYPLFFSPSSFSSSHNFIVFFTNKIMISSFLVHILLHDFSFLDFPTNLFAMFWILLLPFVTYKAFFVHSFLNSLERLKLCESEEKLL